MVDGEGPHTTKLLPGLAADTRTGQHLGVASFVTVIRPGYAWKTIRLWKGHFETPHQADVLGHSLVLLVV